MSSDTTEADPLARHHAAKEGKQEEKRHGVDARLRTVAAVTFWNASQRSRTIPSHGILCIDTDPTDAREERVIITHHLGVIQIIGTGLEPLAARIRRMNIGDVRIGALADGGRVDRIVWE